MWQSSRDSPSFRENVKSIPVEFLCVVFRAVHRWKLPSLFAMWTCTLSYLHLTTWSSNLSIRKCVTIVVWALFQNRYVTLTKAIDNHIPNPIWDAFITVPKKMTLQSLAALLNKSWGETNNWRLRTNNWRLLCSLWWQKCRQWNRKTAFIHRYRDKYLSSVQQPRLKIVGTS